MEAQGVLLKYIVFTDHWDLWYRSLEVDHLVLPEDPGSEGVGGNHKGRVTIIQLSNLILTRSEEHRDWLLVRFVLVPYFTAYL